MNWKRWRRGVSDMGGLFWREGERERETHNEAMATTLREELGPKTESENSRQTTSAPEQQREPGDEQFGTVERERDPLRALRGGGVEIYLFARDFGPW